MSKSSLYRLMKMKNPLTLRQASKRTLNRHKEVQSFYLSPANSTQLSERKKVKTGKPCNVLKDSLLSLYTQYKANSLDPVSFSLFKKLRPSNVRLAKTEQLKVCQNVQLVPTSLMKKRSEQFLMPSTSCYAQKTLLSIP